MKTIIFLLILLCLPFSANWGQDCDFKIQKYVSDTLKGIPMDFGHNDIQYVYKYRYDSLQEYADSLEKEIQSSYLQGQDDIREFLVSMWHDSIAVLNGRLAEYNHKVKDDDFSRISRVIDSMFKNMDTLPKSLPQWPGYWRIDTVEWLLCCPPQFPILDTTWRPRVPREGDK